MIKEFDYSAINIPKAVYLYDEGIKGLELKEVKDFLEENFGRIKVRLIKLKNKVVSTSGLFLDLIKTQKEFSRLPYSKDKDACHIILTEKLFATLDKDNRPHIRASIYTYPSIISTSGIVEGPAKPREYYRYKQRFMQLGAWDMEEQKLKRKFKGEFIDYQDRRMAEVLKGYIAQGLFFYMTGEPFCEKKDCRLFNAHWQEDLIYAQVKKGRFCPSHKKVLNRISQELKM